MVAAKSEDNGGVQEFQFHLQKNESKWVTFKKALYDPSTKAVLGRTGKSWGQLFLFYAVFYAVLAALFAICIQGLFATLKDNEPRWTLSSSLIGTNPGLGFRPISNRTEEGSLIWYNMTNQTEITRWVTLVDEFMEPYTAAQTGDNYVNCDFDKPPGEGKVCVTNITEMLGNCNRGSSYGYNTASPCIFLKLNRIFGWEPQYYTSPLPEMPEELRNHINGTEEERVWVTCQGVDDVDKENVKDFEYFPKGFASYYYPYRNYKNYVSPIVAVQLKAIKTNVIVSIECRAWAKNIVYRGGSLNRAGSVQFEVQESQEKRQLLPSIYEPGDIKNFNPRTSTPILERKSFQNISDSSGYRRWCKDIERSGPNDVILGKGARISLPDKSVFCGHLIPKQDGDVFNHPILDEEIKDTLKERIFNLFNGSYKTFIQKTTSILHKKKKKENKQLIIPK